MIWVLCGSIFFPLKIQWLQLKIQHYKYASIWQSSKLEPAVQRQVIPWTVGYCALRNHRYLPLGNLCPLSNGSQRLLRDLHPAQKIVEMAEVPPEMHVRVCSRDLAQESGKAFMMVS